MKYLIVFPDEVYNLSQKSWISPAFEIFVSKRIETETEKVIDNQCDSYATRLWTHGPKVIWLSCGEKRLLINIAHYEVSQYLGL